MNNSGIESSDSRYENHISEIIQEELIDLHGRNGYRSIMQTMMKIYGKTEKDIKQKVSEIMTAVKNQIYFLRLIMSFFINLLCHPRA